MTDANIDVNELVVFEATEDADPNLTPNAVRIAEREARQAQDRLRDMVVHQRETANPVMPEPWPGPPPTAAPEMGVDMPAPPTQAYVNPVRRYRVQRAQLMLLIDEARSMVDQMDREVVRTYELIQRFPGEDNNGPTGYFRVGPFRVAPEVETMTPPVAYNYAGQWREVNPYANITTPAGLGQQAMENEVNRRLAQQWATNGTITGATTGELGPL